MAASRSLTAMATWSISVSIMGGESAPVHPSIWCHRSVCCGASPPQTLRWSEMVGWSGAVAPEQRDLVLADAFALGRVVDAEALGRRQAEDADLALVLVAVDRPGGDA